MVDDKISHLKWLIEKKLGDTFRFEQRQLQIIGINMLLFSFLMLNLTDFSGLENGIQIVIGLASVGLIIIYLRLSLPRSVKVTIDGKNNEISDSKEKIKIDMMLWEEKDLTAYYNVLVESVRNKARWMKWSYRCFGVSITGIILLIILSTF